MLGGDGPRAIAVMWSMTFVSFILLLLRFYTRTYILKAVGLDDFLFTLAWVGPRPI